MYECILKMLLYKKLNKAHFLYFWVVSVFMNHVCKLLWIKDCVFKQLLHTVLSVIQSGEHLCSANRNMDRGDLASPQ